MIKDIWFALVEIIPINNNKDLEGVIGAFVNVAYRAKSKERFINKVKLTFEIQNFKVITFDDIEYINDLTADNPETAEKLSLLEDLNSGEDFSWGVFHTYNED